MSDQNVCPKFEKALSILNKRWTGLIIFQLLNGSKRFHMLEEGIGISGRVLSERLKELEQENIIKREVFNETPVRIEYSLTDKGKNLEGLLVEIQKWSEQWIDVSEAQS